MVTRARQIRDPLLHAEFVTSSPEFAIVSPKSKAWLRNQAFSLRKTDYFAQLSLSENGAE
jgi:hypothetical protein